MPEDNKLILIVDDSSFMRTILRVAMQAQGYEVREAANGNRAIAELESAVPDLVISDFDMPEVDGLQLLEYVRSDNRTCNVPVLILSSRNDTALKAQAKQSGAGWVQKPFQTADFLQLVTQTIGSAAVTQ